MEVTYKGTPLMTYEEWLEDAGVPSAPIIAEAYRRYEARWRADQADDLNDGVVIDHDCLVCGGTSFTRTETGSWACDECEQDYWVSDT